MSVAQEEVARHGRWLVEILVPAAYVMIIVAYIVILVALTMGAGYPPKWTPGHWSAFAEMPHFANFRMGHSATSRREPRRSRFIPSAR